MNLDLLSATFTNAGSGIPTASITWGDGTSTNPATVAGNAVTGSHTYAATGTYIVSVAVACAGGCAGSDDVNVTVAPAPIISINDVSIIEGDSGTQTATFVVSLSALSKLPVTVNYATADGTAVAPGDYLPSTGVVTFAPGTTSQTIPISIVGDLLNEDDETFTVNLTLPTNATIGRASVRS
ncbi:MAG TPA: Calx-beta domain-containing protein [Thermoanaerobaculia bacterium]